MTDPSAVQKTILAQTLIAAAAAGKAAEQAEAAAAGLVRQIIQVTSSTEIVVVGTTFIEVLSAVITPQKAANKIIIFPGIEWFLDGVPWVFAGFRLLRNGVVIYDPNPTDADGPFGLGVQIAGATNHDLYGFFTPMFLDAPASDSEVTYSIQGRGYLDTTMIVNQTTDTTKSGMSTMTLIEVQP